MQRFSLPLSGSLQTLFHAQKRSHFQSQNRRKLASLYQRIGCCNIVDLGLDSFAFLSPDMIQKYTEQFKQPELFASISGQIVSVPVELETPLRTAEMPLEDNYGMIDKITNNGRHSEELEKVQAEVRRTTPEKKPSIRERLEDAKRECASWKAPDKPTAQKSPWNWVTYEPEQEVASEMGVLPGRKQQGQYNKLRKDCVHSCKQSFRALVASCPKYLSLRSQKRRNRGSK